MSRRRTKGCQWAGRECQGDLIRVACRWRGRREDQRSHWRRSCGLRPIVGSLLVGPKVAEEPSGSGFMARKSCGGGKGLRDRKNGERVWSGDKRKPGHMESLSISLIACKSCKGPKYWHLGCR